MNTIILHFITVTVISVAFFFIGRKHGQYYDKAKDIINNQLSQTIETLDNQQRKIETLKSGIMDLAKVSTAREIKYKLKQMLKTL